MEYTEILDGESLQVSAIILKTLRDTFGNDNARFKSIEQAEAIKELLKRDSDVAVILPTGGGKSLIYQLPMLIERDMTTVVIVPFVALVEQGEEQCKELGISRYIWTNRGYSSGDTQAILVGVKYVVKVVGNEVESMRNLNRVIARTIYEAVPNWKKEDRGLIYCLKTVWTEELTKYLNEKLKQEVCGVYNAKMGKKERQDVLNAWKSGKVRFLATTSALGAGLDYG